LAAVDDGDDMLADRGALLYFCRGAEDIGYLVEKNHERFQGWTTNEQKEVGKKKFEERKWGKGKC
jgi:hypothetical protein